MRTAAYIKQPLMTKSLSKINHIEVLQRSHKTPRCLQEMTRKLGCILFRKISFEGYHHLPKNSVSVFVSLRLLFLYGEARFP